MYTKNDSIKKQIEPDNRSGVKQSFRDIDRLIQINRAYKKALLKELLKGTLIDLEDLDILQVVILELNRRGEKFEEWVLRAEDAIQTLKKNIDVENMEEIDERIP